MLVAGPERQGTRRCIGPGWHGWPAVVLPVLGLALACRPALAAISTRGMSPEEVVLFSARETFECRYSGKVLSVARLNDDFCDCPEGTDEPGTSACAYGVFYCANKGHVPVRLPSSRVNDGICDCCDGSDEYNGWVKCDRTCSTAASLADSAGVAAAMERELESARLRQKIIWRALHKGKRRATRHGARHATGGTHHRKEMGGAEGGEERATAEDAEPRKKSVEEEREEAAAEAGAAVGPMLGLEVATTWLLLAVLFSVCWARMRALSRAPWRRRGSFRRLRSRELSMGSFPRAPSAATFPRVPSGPTFPRVPSGTSFPRQARAGQAPIFT